MSSGKIESVSKIPFAGTLAEIQKDGKTSKGKYCSPKEFETKALSHLGRLYKDVVKLINGTLVFVPVPVAFDPMKPTQAEVDAITDARENNDLFDTANARLMEFLDSSLEGIPLLLISAYDRNGVRMTGKEAWDMLMIWYKLKEVTELETELESLKIDIYKDLEVQFAKFDDLVGQIAIHKNGGTKSDTTLMVKF
jgi:hypothetical protein